MERITPEDDLYRRMAPGFLKPDGTISSAAYKTNSMPDKSISVDLARLTTPAESLGRVKRPGFRLGQLSAAVPFSLQFIVRLDPIEGNYSHSLIEGENTKEKCRRLAKETVIL